MGIHWNSYGWDCPDCGDYDACRTAQPTMLKHNPAEYARITKSAADHSRNCPALNEVGQYPRDYDQIISDLRSISVYTERVPDQLTPDPEPFDQFGLRPAPLPVAKPEPPATPAMAPETIMDGIERILAADLPHAQKQAKVKPHENYRLRPEDRTDGHPTRPR